jgi:hypothetical protein
MPRIQLTLHHEHLAAKVLPIRIRFFRKFFIGAGWIRISKKGSIVNDNKLYERYFPGWSNINEPVF